MKIKKSKIAKAMLCCGLILGHMQYGGAYAAQGKVDVTPPWARVTVVGAAEDGNTNYVTNTNLQIEIYAHDDTCADNEIQYYFSETPIDKTTPLAEEDWEEYKTGGITIPYTLKSETDVNSIYVAFRDKIGNTTLIYEGADVEYTVKYNANGGSGDIIDGTGYHGMAYIVTNQTPKRDGFYFIGWGTSSTSTDASYAQGDIISADAFNGSNKVINLYAVWSESKDKLKKLADVAEVGDYVDYPVYYENVNTNGTISSLRGWRVLSKNVSLSGDAEEGTVNLISAGVPLTYYHNGQSSDSEVALTTNFLTTEFDENIVRQKFVKNGFLGYSDLKDVFTNAYTAVDSNSNPKVRSITKEDLFRATGYTQMYSGMEMDLANPRYAELYKVGANYWLASAYNSSHVWYVFSSGSVNGNSGIEFGLRPVVSLKSNVKTYEKDTQGRWQIEIEEK